MGYQALYRAWRPRTFVDVVGQLHITKTLQNAISERKFSHAYLFSGPRGTGKTSAAKIFAQTINCEQMPTREPCNECAACLGILDGSISDVIEIDAASNTSVDDIRDIRDHISYATSAVPYKVYIIDEVHMISTNAFNALLKTLEEPPAHVVFILATTEPHKIPLTVISRCQRFDFKPISNETIVNRMKVIMEHENIAISSEALEAVALAADGGMRDALSILDQAISYSDGEVTIEDVLAVTGGVSQHVLTDMLQAMYEQDLKETLQLFDSIIQSGKDPGRFVFDFIYFLRDVLFYKTTSQLESYLERAVVNDTFKQLTELVEVDWIQYAMMQFTKCEQQIKWTNNPKVFVEVTILSVAQRFELDAPKEQEGSSEQMMQLAQKVTKLEKQLQKLASTEPSPKQSAPVRREPKRASSGLALSIPTGDIRNVLDEAEKEALQQVRSQWGMFLEQLKKTNPQAQATLQDSKPVAASSRAIVIAFKYDIHCKLMQDHREAVETVLTNVLGKPISTLAIPENRWLELREEYLMTQQKENKEEDKEESEPEIVEQARKLFGEEIVEVHD